MFLFVTPYFYSSSDSTLLIGMRLQVCWPVGRFRRSESVVYLLWRETLRISDFAKFDPSCEIFSYLILPYLEIGGKKFPSLWDFREETRKVPWRSSLLTSPSGLYVDRQKAIEVCCCLGRGGGLRNNIRLQTTVGRIGRDHWATPVPLLLSTRLHFIR